MREPATGAIVVALVLAGMSMSTAWAQTPASTVDQWAPVRFLLGSWEGTSSGQPGTATVRREYRFALREQFIEERHTSTYPPQEKNPKGEVHEQVSYISYDRSRKQLMLWQFHVERFVIQYRQESEAPGVTLAFLSESLENTPAGWRRRVWRRQGRVRLGDTSRAVQLTRECHGTADSFDAAPVPACGKGADQLHWGVASAVPPGVDDEGLPRRQRDGEAWGRVVRDQRQCARD